MERLDEHITWVRDDWEGLSDIFLYIDRSEQDLVFENLDRALEELLGMGSYLVCTLKLSWSGDSEEIFDPLAQAGLMIAEQSTHLNTLISQRQAVINGDVEVVGDIVINHLDSILTAGRTMLNHAPNTPGAPSTGLHPLIVEHREALVAVAEKHGLTDLRVYGSMARGDADEYSDVDLLVNAPPEVDCLPLIYMGSDAEQLLKRPVDLNTYGELMAEQRAQRARILREAIPLKAPPSSTDGGRKSPSQSFPGGAILNG